MMKKYIPQSEGLTKGELDNTWMMSLISKSLNKRYPFIKRIEAKEDDKNDNKKIYLEVVFNPFEVENTYPNDVILCSFVSEEWVNWSYRHSSNTTPASMFDSVDEDVPRRSTFDFFETAFVNEVEKFIIELNYDSTIPATLKFVKPPSIWGWKPTNKK